MRTEVNMAKGPLSQNVTIPHERTGAYHTATIDSVTTVYSTDAFYDRITVTLGRNETRIIQERASRSVEGTYNFIPNSIPESRLVKAVEFEAIFTPHAAIDLCKGVTNALKNMPQDRQQRLGIDVFVIGLRQVFDL